MQVRAKRPDNHVGHLRLSAAAVNRYLGAPPVAADLEHGRHRQDISAGTAQQRLRKAVQQGADGRQVNHGDCPRQHERTGGSRSCDTSRRPDRPACQSRLIGNETAEDGASRPPLLLASRRQREYVV